MEGQEWTDVVVVGAGFAGLSAAKAYVQCEPKVNLIILDSNQSLGGTWSEERLYPTLRSNNLRGTLEHPDYPFHDGFGVKHNEHLPGPVVHEYLVEYAKHWNIFDRIRYQAKTLSVVKVDDEKRTGWCLTVQAPNQKYKLFTEKLIIATGLTSQPKPLSLVGQETFGAPLIKCADLARDCQSLLEDPNVKRVTVLGGSKSAYDAVYLFASHGKQVDWIIRKTGNGPIIMTNPYTQIGPLGKFWVELLATTRILAWMSPCLFGGLDGSGWWRYLLNQTWLGQKILALFWWKLTVDTLEQGGYYNDPKLKPLVPDCSMLEIATSVAILNYPSDILDLVRSGQVQAFREDVSHVSDHAVHLGDGTVLESDAFIASTGWMHNCPVEFEDKSLHSELGIPSTDYSEEQKAFWANLDAKADAEVFRRFPILTTLKYPPEAAQEDLAGDQTAERYPPWRLYRSLVPPGLAAKGDRSLAFAGFSSAFATPIRNELAGLWIYAYMNDKLKLDPCRDVKDLHWEAALLQRFCYRRHPYGLGRRHPDFVFDQIPFIDLLLSDLGIDCTRKGKWYKEWFEPYTVADYRGITAEWLREQKQGNKIDSNTET